MYTSIVTNYESVIICMYVCMTRNCTIYVCSVYADNISNCAETVRNLQLQLDKVELFCRRMGMIVNIDKTKILFSGTKKF